MSADADKAMALREYDRTRKAIEGQRRYIAQGQREVAGRIATLLSIEAEHEWAKALVSHHVEGKTVDWAALREAKYEVRDIAEDIREVYRPAPSMTEPEQTGENGNG